MYKRRRGKPQPETSSIEKNLPGFFATLEKDWAWLFKISRPQVTQAQWLPMAVRGNKQEGKLCYSSWLRGTQCVI